jgi:uncharacterized protein YecA (UPF0149 family)
MRSPDDTPAASSEPAPTAAPRDDQPYALPLDAPQLEELQRVLGGFGVNGLVGLFCAAASVPGFADAEQWLPELIHNVPFADEAQFRRTVALAMSVNTHVRAALREGRAASLVPGSGDAEGCRQWAHGYAALLVRVDAAHRNGKVIDAAFAIHALAEIPQFLDLLDKEHGADERPAYLGEFRMRLADHVASLHAAWTDARAQTAAPPPVVRFAPKLGRNDPCPCGSGKKHKKCCGAR